MILLMGGTSQSALIAEAIANTGFSVLISMATDIPLELPRGANIGVRRGRLDEEQLRSLIEESGITALVDATHPFALQAHTTAKQAAQKADIPYIHWMREESDLSGFTGLHMADNHSSAARLAAALKCPILLTIGSRNISPYVHAARTVMLPVFARVLPCHESEEACRSAGLDASEVIAARGPFTVEDTLALIRSLKIGTLVTKESGQAGGVPDKLDAATRANCNIVIVRRKAFEEGDLCRNIDELLGWLASCHHQTH